MRALHLLRCLLSEVLPWWLVADASIRCAPEESHVRDVVYLFPELPRVESLLFRIGTCTRVLHHEVEGEDVVNVHLRGLDLFQGGPCLCAPVRCSLPSHEDIHEQQDHVFRRRCPHTSPGRTLRDRKSTRLNSS